ncbi:hypothetical protein BKA83DRAFT_4261038 [Pisolithus microcarpus]|nr:hypothetical protein BKA83DRAFT_4387602 [Pisolithus microcarpus]KAI6023526.1 hypothetical protein BKA83DRAFT_4261038 [Pisolithus microcarpus]
MHGPESPSCGSPEASSFLRRPEDLRRFLDDIIRVATAAKSLLRSCGGLREASTSRTQPPTDSASRSPRRAYSFCFFCGQKGHIRANCDSCKEYLAAGKCLLVKGRVVLPTGQEIPREVPGRTLKDRLAHWDLGNRSKDIRNPPSSPGRLPLEDVGSLEPQTQMVSLGLSQSRLLVHPNTPSERPLCAPLSTEGPSHSIRAPSASSSSSDALLCRPRSPSHTLPTRNSRGRPQSRSRSRGHGRLRSPSPLYFEDSPSCSRRYLQSYSSRSHSRRSHSRDHYHCRSPPPAPSLGRSHQPTLSRDKPELERLASQLVNRLTASSIYSTRSSHSLSHTPAHSRRSRSRSRTPQPSRRWY